jgi:hypothetical protein
MLLVLFVHFVLVKGLIDSMAVEQVVELFGQRVVFVHIHELIAGGTLLEGLTFLLELLLLTLRLRLRMLRSSL